MKPFTFKQRIVCILIKMIDWAINSRKLIPFLAFLILMNRKLFFARGDLNKSSIFKDLSVAFIADGNRRWFRKIQVKKKHLEDRRYLGFLDWLPANLANYIKSHASFLKTKSCKKSDFMGGKAKVDSGFKKIQEIIRFAYFNQLKEVSFFCFSIKNFNRPKNEISEIMDYIKESKLFTNNFPINIRIYGKLDLLSQEVRDKLKKITESYSAENALIVNLFIGYSSSSEDTNSERFDGDVDLLIRTSGEKRLSDFFVHQVARGTSVDFVNPYWPEFSIAHLRLCLYKFILERKYLSD